MSFKVVLVFNQLVSFNRQFGQQHLNKLTEYLHKQWDGNVEIVPILNGRQNSYEDRATKIEEQLKDITRNQKIHLMATGVSGIDSRIVYNNNPNIVSLSTFGSPHKGSMIATEIERGNRKQYEPLQSILGIDIDSLQQMSDKEMQCFNLTYPLSKPLFTAGGVYPVEQQSKLMQQSGFNINRYKQQLVRHDNDGLFAEDEVIYGYSLGIYDLTHPQVIGMGNTFNHFRNALENLRTIESELEY